MRVHEKIICCTVISWKDKQARSNKSFLGTPLIYGRERFFSAHTCAVSNRRILLNYLMTVKLTQFLIKPNIFQATNGNLLRFVSKLII